MPDEPQEAQEVPEIVPERARTATEIAEGMPEDQGTISAATEARIRKETAERARPTAQAEDGRAEQRQKFKAKIAEQKREIAELKSRVGAAEPPSTPQPEPAAGADQGQPEPTEAISEQTAIEIGRLPHIAAVNHFLAVNPDLQRMIQAMPLAQRVQEIKRIHADLEEKIFKGNGNGAAPAQATEAPPAAPEAVAMHEKTVSLLGDDAETILAQGKQIPFSAEVASAVRQALLQSENGHEVYAQILRTPDFARTLAKMTPAHAYRTVVELSVERRNPVRTSSGAPPPIKTVSGTARAEVDLDKLADANWRAFTSTREASEKNRYKQ